MTTPDVSGLPTNLDSTYADDPGDPTRKLHQQQHDLIHAWVKAVDTGGIGGSSPFLVAAADAPAAVQSAAGVVCAGDSTDAVTIETALNDYGRVVLSVGTFTIGTPIDITRAGADLTGSGWDTRLQAAAGLNAPVIRTVQPAGSTLNGVRISRLHIDGAKATQAADVGAGGIHLVGTYDAVVSHVRLENCQDFGIKTNRNLGSDPYSAYNRITDCTISHGGAVGIHAQSSTDHNWISRTRVDWHTSGVGVGVALDAWHNKIESCHFDANLLHVRSSYSHDNQILDTTFDRAINRHLHIEGAGRVPAVTFTRVSRCFFFGFHPLGFTEIGTRYGIALTGGAGGSQFDDCRFEWVDDASGWTRAVYEEAGVTGSRYLNCAFGAVESVANGGVATLPSQFQPSATIFDTCYGGGIA